MKHEIAVVGAGGRMGALFCREWGGAHTVRGVDRTGDATGSLALRPDDIARALAAADLVLLCVPAPAMVEVLGLIVPRMMPGALLVDICSVKVLPLKAMEAAYPGPVVGTHPFFGPSNNRRGAKVALVPGARATEEHCARVASLYRLMGCDPFFTTAEEHDAASAISQSLHFALSAAYFATVGRREGIEPYLTPSFKRYMNAARKELTANAAMFCEFTEANPLFPDALAEVRGLLEQAGQGGLGGIADEARAWYTKHEASDPAREHN